MTKRINRDDMDRFFDFGVYPTTRTIYVGSMGTEDGINETGTDYAMAEYAIKGLHILDAASDAEITIIMNNLGGDVYHGMAIYDAIKACRSPVTIKATGYAMSMGSIILQAADKRLITPNARFMIHYGHIGMSATHTKNFIKWAKETERSDKEMEDLYLRRIHEKHPDFARKRLQQMLNFDTILTAQETVDLGLADAIEGTDE
jgi:ATP-dependent Clp protease protease subunit